MAIFGCRYVMRRPEQGGLALRRTIHEDRYVIGITATLTLLLALVTVAPMSKHPAWWIRVWDFPRLQILALSLLVLLANLLFLPLSSPLVWTLMAVNLACVIYQAVWIYPYTALSKPQVLDYTGYQSKPRLRILVSNVLTPNRHADKLLALSWRV